ncbi:MAG: enoyl-CoA hydratase/isomerase family protein [Pseudomonadales bacterium]|nr:enoyl-CoA hydratase/isomerase family protein [Pseudomonadales bacterium]
MPDVVLFETKSLNDGRKLGVVTLNAPKTLNSLSLDMIDLMLPQLIKWQDDPQIVLVLFLSAGDRAFSAGGDIQNLYHDMVEHPEGPCPYSDAFFEREYRLDYLIQTYDKPTVVWGQGIAMGGGLGVLTACSHKIGTETTRIAMPEITIGLFPDAGATYALSRMPEHYAYFLAWTGANVNGEDARRVGLIDYLINNDQQEAVIDAITSHAWVGDAATALDQLLDTFVQASSDFPPSQLAIHDQIINETVTTALASDNPVGIFLEQCEKLGGDKWLERAAATFKSGTPTTAAIIYEQIQRAKSMTREQIFAMELTLAIQCSRHADFREGIRALLIEKDNAPNWQYKMGAVPNEWVAAHFAEPWPVNPLSDLN